MLVQRFSFAVIVRLLMQALGFVSLFFVARLMGAEALGLVAFATSYIALFQSFSDLGYGTAHIKRVSEGKDLGICNGTYFTVKIALTVLMCTIVVLSIVIPKYFLKTGNFSSPKEIVIYIVLFSVFISNIAMMFNVTFSARKEVAKQSTGELYSKAGTVIFKVTVALTGLGVFWLAGASVFGAVIWLMVMVYYFRNCPIKKPDKEYFKSYTKFAVPVIFIGFLSKYAEHLDKVMIGYFSTMVEVGKYAAGQRIAMMLLIFITSATGLIFPTISQLHANGEINKIKTLSNKVERFFSMFFFPIAVLITIYATDICNVLLGSEFTTITPQILSILIWFLLVSALMQPYSLQLVSTNHAKLAAKISFLYLGLNILFNFIFIPESLFDIKMLGMGAKGAAIATLSSVIIGSVIYRIYAFKITGSKPNPVVLKHAAAAFIMGLLLFEIDSFFPNRSLFILPVFVIPGLAIYFVILMILKEISRSDVNYLLSFANLKSIKKYAKEEIKS